MQPNRRRRVYRIPRLRVQPKYVPGSLTHHDDGSITILADGTHVVWTRWMTKTPPRQQCWRATFPVTPIRATRLGAISVQQQRDEAARIAVAHGSWPDLPDPSDVRVLALHAPHGPDLAGDVPVSVAA